MPYLKQNLAELNYLKHLVLLYGDGNNPWSKERLKYYVAHFGIDGKPDDWFFDSFLFINTKSSSGRDYAADVNLGKSMSGEGDFYTVCSPNPANKLDWDSLLDFYFGEHGALPALDQTINELSGLITAPDSSRNVVLTLPYPHITQKHFGYLEPGTKNLNFSTVDQNLMQATRSRLEAETWFVDRIVELWSKANFSSINLLGVYWIFETVYRSWEVDDHFLLKELRKHINSRGLKFVWIPFYATYNFHLLDNYKDYYFDIAFLQPNFLFYKKGKCIETAAAVARKAGAGIELEYYMDLDEPISIKNEKHLRFREYLNAGVTQGYMTQSACAHFQGVDSLQKMYHHPDPLEREFYEDIYQFIKRTYKTKPYPPVPAGSHFIPQKRAAISIDLGGTNLRMGVVDETGNVIHYKQESTPKTRETIIDRIIVNVKEGLKFAGTEGLKVMGAGVSSGGRVDYENGVISDSTSLLPDWKNVPIKKIVEKQVDIPVFVDHDGHCAALAEKWFGKGKLSNNFIAIVLGTGIAGGIYVDGKLLRGSRNFASEIGHISVDASGPKCSCGSFGCVELFSSGSGLERWAREKVFTDDLGGSVRDLSAKSIGDAARSGKEFAINLLRSAGEKLGVAATTLVNIFNPDLIVISGSLVELPNIYFQAFKDTLLKCAIKPTADNLEITFSDFPQEVGIIGGAALVFEQVIYDASHCNMSHIHNRDGMDD
ncbi:MAG: ROK family protein [Candidatus Kryptoniota bacterium]